MNSRFYEYAGQAMYSSINAEARTIVECGLAPSTIVRASALCLKTSSYLHTREFSRKVKIANKKPGKQVFSFREIKTESLFV